MTAIRIGVIGLGKIARDQHLPAIAANPDFVLAATVDRSGPAAPPNFTSHEALLCSGHQLDAIAITTPPGPRYAIARDCIAAGLHVLLEKPPTVTLAEIDDLRDRAAEAGVTLFTAWHAQHNPAVTEATKLLCGQRVQSMEINWHEDVEKWHPGQKWIWQAKGFGVFDPGINAFSIASLVYPGVLLVEQAELYFPTGSDTPIAADIQFADADGGSDLRCSLDWRKSAGEEWTISFVTKDGAQQIIILDGGARLLVDGVEVHTSGDGEYADIYRRFSALIKSHESKVDTVPLRMVSDCLLVGSRHSA